MNMFPASAWKIPLGSLMGPIVDSLDSCNRFILWDNGKGKPQKKFFFSGPTTKTGGGLGPDH